MTVIELYNKLCEIIPTSLSCPWDKDGLESCPEPDKDVKKVLISLDVTGEIIEKAATEGADVIISHHPLFFGGLGNMNALTFDGDRNVLVVYLGGFGLVTSNSHQRNSRNQRKAQDERQPLVCSLVVHTCFLLIWF